MITFLFIIQSTKLLRFPWILEPISNISKKPKMAFVNLIFNSINCDLVLCFKVFFEALLKFSKNFKYFRFFLCSFLLFFFTVLFCTLVWGSFLRILFIVHFVGSFWLFFHALYEHFLSYIIINLNIFCYFVEFETKISKKNTCSNFLFF